MTGGSGQTVAVPVAFRDILVLAISSLNRASSSDEEISQVGRRKASPERRGKACQMRSIARGPNSIDLVAFSDSLESGGGKGVM
jgi:hypothetical protein